MTVPVMVATPSPVTAMPAVVPAPVTTVPVPVPMVTPSHLFRLEALDFGGAGDGRMDIRTFRRRHQMRCQRRGVRSRSRSKRGRARDKSKGEFQKMAAFHDLFSLGW
jgi:hypothetical protein